MGRRGGGGGGGGGEGGGDEEAKVRRRGKKLGGVAFVAIVNVDFEFAAARRIESADEDADAATLLLFAAARARRSI